MTRVSFEFFPPKTDAMEDTLWATIQKLEPLPPEISRMRVKEDGRLEEPVVFGMTSV